MGIELEVAKALTIEEASRVILENQVRLTRDMHESDQGISEETLKGFIERDLNEAKRHIYPLFRTAQLAIDNPEQIVVYRIAGEPFCGVYDKPDQTIYAERTILGRDYVSAQDVESFHQGKVPMYDNDFSNLLTTLMSKARLRVHFE
jgi:hypothetical protein